MTDTTDVSAGGASGELPDLPGPLWTMVLPQAEAPPQRQGSHDGPGPRHAASLAYELDERPEPPPVPNGWYAAVGSDDLPPGGVRSFVAVARELVAYRDHDGTPHVIDAHCPHLGAHLGGGQVVGDSIKCPYHGWRYGPDGTCVEIPYHDGHIPARACVPSYPVREQDGFVLFWFHHAGAEPSFEVPAVEQLAEGGWSEAFVWETELVAALAEMAENNVDYAHLRYVHRRPTVPNDTSVFTTDGPFSTVVEALDEHTTFARHAYGPGVAVLEVPGMMLLYATTTPVDRRHCRLRWHFHFPPDAVGSAAAIIDGVTGEYGLQADIPIWRDKVYKRRPVLVRSDGNIAEFRQWYAQFYEGVPGWDPAED